MKNRLKFTFFCASAAMVLTLASQAFSQILHPAEKSKTARLTSEDFKTFIDFYNESGQTIKLFCLDGKGNRVFIVSLKSGEYTTETTYLSQPWLATDERNNALALYYPDAQPREIRIDGSGNGGTHANRLSGVSAPNRARRNETDEDDEYYADSNRKYDETPITICRDQPVPRGYVVVKSGNDFSCPNWNAVSSNTYTIKRPSRTDTTVVCGSQPIPRGFVIVGAKNEFGCPNWNAVNNNSYVIRRPRDTESICSVSDVPRGYVVTGTYSEFACPNWNAVNSNAKKIKRVN